MMMNSSFSSVMNWMLPLLFRWGNWDPRSQMAFPDSSVGKESTCNAGDPDSVPGSGRSPEVGIGYPLQFSWASLVAQLVKNPPAVQETWVRFLGWEDPWRRERLPTPVFWPGEFHGLYSPWGCKESDTTIHYTIHMTFTFTESKYLLLHGVSGYFSGEQRPQTLFVIIY